MFQEIFIRLEFIVHQHIGGEGCGVAGTRLVEFIIVFAFLENICLIHEASLNKELGAHFEVDFVEDDGDQGLVCSYFL